MAANYPAANVYNYLALVFSSTARLDPAIRLAGKSASTVQYPWDYRSQRVSLAKLPVGIESLLPSGPTVGDVHVQISRRQHPRQKLDEKIPT